MTRAELSGAWRALRRSPGFATITVLSLALGIGLNTTLLSVIEAALLRPLPYEAPERLVVVQDTRMTGEGHFLTAAEVEDFAASTRTLAAVGAYRAGMADRYALRVETPEGPATGYEVSANMLAILGAHPREGRILTPDDARSAEQPVVIGERLRDRLFGAGQPAVGRLLDVGGVTRTIVGVMPRSFWFPAEEGTFWVPLSTGGGAAAERSLSLVGRLAPGSGPAAAAAEAEILVARLDDAAAAAPRPRWARTATLDEARRPSDRAFFLVLQGVVFSILLIACSNVAGLSLVRIIGRRRETAIRAAVGASRWQLLQPLLAENLILAGAAVAAGVAGSLLLLRLVLTSLPASTPLRDLVVAGLNLRLLLTAAALGALVLLVCTVLPALQATRADLNLVLKEEGGHSGRGTSAAALRRMMVVLQIAVAVVLLVCSGVLLDFVRRANAWDPGFETRGLLTASVSVVDPGGHTALAPVAASLLRELSASPEVRAAAVETRLIPTGGQVSASAGERGATCRCVEVSHDYLETLGIPVLRGRGFDDGDRADRTLAVVDQRLASALWGESDPVGETLRLGAPGARASIATVVGVARAADFARPRADGAALTTPGVYILSAFDSVRAGTLFVSARGGVPPIARVIAGAVEGAEVRGPEPISAVLRAELEPLRWYARIFAAFAALGLLLAMLGLYGVVSYGTLQRQRELAIRAALGATARQIAPLVFRQGIGMVGWGLALGAFGGYLAAEVVRSLLHGASTLSPGTVAAISLVVAAVVAGAHVLPLRRALRVDPAEALRSS